MPDTPSITIVKKFTYKNLDELWSCKYHFSGDTPANAGEWTALAVAIWNEERKFLSTAVSAATAYGYVAGNDNSVFQLDWQATPPGSAAGNLNDASPAPGDSAVWVRWTTPSRNSKGRPIYGRKYFHGVPSAGGDAIASTTRTLMATYGAKMIDGTLPGSFRVCGPQGAAYSTPKVAPFIGFRQLKRTGKRPT